MKLNLTLFEGITEESKICVKCKEDLPLSSFSNASGGNYLRSECRLCEKDLTKIRKQIKKSAPVPPKDHKCPICQRTSEEVLGEGGKKSGEWCCDHNHKTNKFRGWLCHSCNRALGNFVDDIDRLERAIKYLKNET